MQFSDLRLSEPILRAVAAEGYSTPTPIQAQAIPVILEGKDLLGVAQTGTGKTAAFALPMIQLLAHHRTPGPRALILSPTRELATQISESFRVYGKNSGLARTVVFGGVGYRPQIEAIKRGVDVLIATPGRLMDLMGQGACDLSHVGIFVLDEADRMLDMGFIHDIRKIVSHIPKKRQTLFFSATMPKDIRALASSILTNPVSVEVAPQSTAAETVDQAVYFAERREKPWLLLHMLERQPATDRVLIFTRTKHGADRVAEGLSKHGIPAEAIHGNKRQNARAKALDAFRKGHAPVLVATDVASRGIDIDEIELVVNYEIPNVPETYVHRIGRTGRAGAKGKAISFCDHEEKPWLRAIERLMRRPITVVKTPAFERKAPVVVAAHAPHAPAPSHAPTQDRGHDRGGRGAGGTRGDHSNGGRGGHNDRREQGFRGHGEKSHGSAPHGPSHGSSHSSSHGPSRTTPHRNAPPSGTTREGHERVRKSDVAGPAPHAPHQSSNGHASHPRPARPHDGTPGHAKPHAKGNDTHRAGDHKSGHASGHKTGHTGGHTGGRPGGPWKKSKTGGPRGRKGPGGKRGH